MSLADALRELTRSMLGEFQFTPPEVASRAGVDLDLARRLWRAMGFPPVPDDDKVFTRADVAALRIAYELGERRVADPGIQLQITRVAGQALARIAEAQVAAAVESSPDGVSGTVIDPENASQLVPMLESFLTYTWRRHLVAAAWRQLADVGDTPGPEKQAAVGFADLVGFTATSRHLTERELASLIDRFEALVYDHVPERGGRVIKMIGDEVMFAADDVASAAEIAFGLVTPDSDRPLPPLRVGFAVGGVLLWQGDLFGTTVNLAHRLVNAARPGTILISEQAAEQLRTDERFVLRPIRGLPLKGLGRMRIYVLRRAEP